MTITGGTVSGTDIAVKQEAGTLTITGGKINNSGTGIAISGGTASLSDGEISGCGIGIVMGNDSEDTLDLSGGSISGNTAMGINFSGGTLNISGNPSVSGNGPAGTPKNVQIASGETLTVTDTLTGTLGITLADGTGVFTAGLKGKGGASGFSSDNSAYTVGLTAAGEAILGYTVTYDGSGNTGGTAPAAAVVDPKKPVNAAPSDTFTRTGYTFTGWNSKADGLGTAYTVGEPVSPLESALTLYAQWSANSYKVLFDKNAADATGTMAAQNFTYDADLEALTKNSFIRANYLFSGWNTVREPTEAQPGTSYADMAKVKNLSADPNGEVTLYAQWTVTKVPVSKLDAVSGNALAGASLQVTGEGGTVVKSWTSTEDVCVIEGLTKGVSYTLHEAAAPGSYAAAADSNFVIDEDGNITTNGELTEGVLVVRDLRKITASAEDVEVTYDGNVHGITLSVKDAVTGSDLSGAEIKYGTSEGSYTLDTKPAYTDAGEYTVYYQVSKANYQTVTGSAKVTIAPVTLKVRVANKTVTYNGKEQSGNTAYIFTGVLSSHISTLSYTPAKGTNASAAAYDNGAFGNDLKVMSGVTDVTKNYRLADTDKTAGTLTINKAQNPMEVESTASVKRGGNIIDLSKKVSGAVGDVSYGISEMDVYCSINAEGVLTSGSDTGTCTVQVGAAGDDNHEPKTLYITVTVSDKDSGILTVSQDGITYGESLPDPIYLQPIEGGTETFIYSGTKADGTSYGPTAEKPTDAGSYTVGLTYETNDKVYHGSASFAIARKQITVRVANKRAVYTGFEQSGESEPRFSGVPDGHTAAISYTPANGTEVGIYTNGTFGNDLRVLSDQKDVTVNFDLMKKTTGTLTITGALPYNIIYYLDSGSNNEANPDFYTEEDEDIILADPAKAGDAYAAEYIFGGWFEDDAFMKPVANTPETPAIPKGSTGEKIFYARWISVSVDQKTEIPKGALDSLSVSQETAAAIINDTKVEGVALQSSGDAGGNTGALDTILEMAAEGGSGIEAKDANGNPLPQTAAAEKMAEAAAVEVTITVNVTPQTFEENSMTVFKLDPVASITAKDENGDTTAEIFGVKVDNSMIDQSQPIVVSLYTGFKPVQVVHYDDRNRVIDVFTGNNISYDEGTGICQVTIYCFSYIRTNNAENQQTIYEVSFDANGGSPVKTQQVVSEKNADKPGDPKKDGYGFMGWFQKTESGVSDTAFSFDSEITGDIVLAAK